MPISVPVTLSEVQGEIVVSDLLLYRGNGFLSSLIRTVGRSEYSHAAKVDRLEDERNGELCCIETREWEGAKTSTLAEQVRKYPGQIDVYRTNPHNVPDYDRRGAADFMRQYLGASYGYRGVWRAAFDFFPLVRWFAPHDYMRENGNSRGVVPFCSQLCAMADQMGGGVDPVPNLANRITLPGDLARSLFYQYKFTLTGV